MTPIVINGHRLGVERNGVFTGANTSPIPAGRLWPDAALTWLAMRSDYVAHGGHPDEFAPGGPASSARTFKQQVDLQRHWAALGQPQRAAQPGTSNHGWAIAVDCPSAHAQAWLLTHGPKYGWSHDEGARVGEQWHFRYVGLSARQLRQFRRDPLLGFTPAERRWIAEYDRLDRARLDRPRRDVLKRVMREQRKRIWKSAQPAQAGGDGKGWTGSRKRRYAALLARTQ